jgi:hypothetical protein
MVALTLPASSRRAAVGESSYERLRASPLGRSKWSDSISLDRAADRNWVDVQPDMPVSTATHSIRFGHFGMTQGGQAKDALTSEEKTWEDAHDVQPGASTIQFW